LLVFFKVSDFSDVNDNEVRRVTTKRYFALFLRQNSQMRQISFMGRPTLLV